MSITYTQHNTCEHVHVITEELYVNHSWGKAEYDLEVTTILRGKNVHSVAAVLVALATGIW